MGSLSDHRAGDLLRRELSLGQIWRWWVGELAGLLPRGHGRGWRRSALVLRLGEGEWTAFRDQGRRREEIARLGGGAAAEPAAAAVFAERLRRQLRGGTAVILELPADRALVRELSLPAAAEATLPELLAFEIERQTPFPASQASFYHQIIARRPPTPAVPAGGIVVRLTAVPRQLVEGACRAAAGLGLTPAAVVVEGLEASDQGRLSLLGGGTGASAPFWTPLNRGLAALVALLGLAAALSPPLSQELESRRLAEEARRLAPAARAVLAEREALSSAKLTLATALAARGQAPPTVEVLAALTRALPDDTWLGFLSLSGRELVIEGMSRSAAALVGPIEASGRFGRVSFRAPVTRDPASQLERFQLAIEIKEPGS